MPDQPADGFHRLNQFFYGEDPTTYFRDRLSLLGLRAAKSEALAELIGEGAQWGQLKLGREEGSELSPAQDDARTTRYVITESQVLLHHTSEALIRMFLAHTGRPECPWLEMSALLRFTEFRDRVTELAAPAWPDERRNSVAEVFLGGTATAEPVEGWDESVDACARFLRLLAARLDADKNLYNSAKHGMTVMAGHGSLDFFTNEGQRVIGSDGTQVVYLEREQVSKTEYTWYEKTQWLNPEQAVWMTHMAIKQMEALWTVARWRYLGHPFKGLELVTAEAIDAAVNGFKLPGSITHFRKAFCRERRQPKT